MEQDQELRQLDRKVMAQRVEESRHNEPEEWYKIVRKAGDEELRELSSHSEDEPNLSRGKT